MSYVAELAIGLALTPVARWLRRRGMRRAQRRNERAFLALAIITPPYARYGTNEQLEDIYDMWHDKPAWHPDAAGPPKPWWPRYNRRVHGTERPWEER